MESVKSPALAGAIRQLKVRLLGIGPMIWHRALVPDSVSLRELHSVIQLATSWEGIHPFGFVVRGVRYAGPDLSGTSADVPLPDFRFRRKGSTRVRRLKRRGHTLRGEGSARRRDRVVGRGSMNSRKENDLAVTACRDVKPASPQNIDFEAGCPLDETRHSGLGTAPAGLRPS